MQSRTSSRTGLLLLASFALFGIWYLNELRWEKAWNTPAATMYVERENSPESHDDEFLRFHAPGAKWIFTAGCVALLGTAVSFLFGARRR